MNKKIYIIRHAEKGPDGELTQNGINAAQKLGETLGHVDYVYSSPSSRTQETAKLLTSKEPIVEPRLGYYMASPEKSKAINEISATKGIEFLEAAKQFSDFEVNMGIKETAERLNTFINEVFSKMNDGEIALLVSHDLSISPAIEQRNGLPLESIPFLSGYILSDNGEVERFSA